MIELKTLKDVPDWRGRTPYGVDREDLKDEAIKWIKSIRKINFEVGFRPFELGGMKFDNDYEMCDINGAIKMLMHFFNITEEDFKCQKN